MMRTPKLGFLPQESSAVAGSGGPVARWYERLRDIVLRNPEPASRAYRFMSRLIDREFPRGERGVCLAFSSPDSDKVTADAVLMLAYCLRGELDSRVLIVDARLKDQAAGVTGRLGLEQCQGFAEVLREGYAGREGLVLATQVENVDVLPAGDPRGEGDTPMDAERLRQLMDAARRCPTRARCAPRPRPTRCSSFPRRTARS
jgi:hypothetical protein